MPFLSAILLMGRATFAEIACRHVLDTWQRSRNAVSMRVGSELEAARTKAGISVDLISKRIKFSVAKLVALEKGDVKNLPTGLYLFSMVRAYAREVHIDAEPIVERLRAEFAEKDALDALHALDATGALDGKSSADPRRPRERSNLFRNAIVATVGVLIGAAGAGAYLYRMGGAREVRGTKTIRSSQIPTVNSPNKMESGPLSSSGSVTSAPTGFDSAHAAGATHTAASTKPRGPKPRTAAVTQAPEETGAPTGAVSDALGSPAEPQIAFPSPARAEEPADRPSKIEESRPEVPVAPAAP